MNVLWEAMVAELRATRTELDNQRHFTPEKQPIETTRDYLDRWTVGREAASEEVVVAKSTTGLNRAAADGLFEVG